MERALWHEFGSAEQPLGLLIITGAGLRGSLPCMGMDLGATKVQRGRGAGDPDAGNLRSPVGASDCTDAGPFTGAVSQAFIDMSVPWGNTGGTQSFCSNQMTISPYPPQPYNNPTGRYAFNVDQGGGVSWLTGSEYISQFRGWIMWMYWYVQGDVWWLTLANSSEYPVVPGCGGGGYAPAVYGKLASPDLDGNGIVNDQDQDLLEANYLGQPVTQVMGWQADFNHQGPNVDASDLAYFAARKWTCCSEICPGGGGGEEIDSSRGEYDARIENLTDTYLLSLMARTGLTRAGELNGW